MRSRTTRIVLICICFVNFVIAVSCDTIDVTNSEGPLLPIKAKVGFHIFPSYGKTNTLSLYVWTLNPLGDPGYQIQGDMSFEPGRDTIGLELYNVLVGGGPAIFYPAWNKFTYPTQTTKPHILELTVHFGEDVAVTDCYEITIHRPDSISFIPLKVDSTYHLVAEYWMW